MPSSQPTQGPEVQHVLDVGSARDVRRGDDDELVGLLLPASEAGRWIPATVFRAPLGPATDADLAQSLVLEHGLSSLADRWWVRRDGEDWQEAWLLEVKPDRLRLRWNNPMLMRSGHGEWVRLADVQIQRFRPSS